MKEILWLLAVAVSLVALVPARERATKLRWLLVVSILVLVGGLYVSRNGILRVALDILLFFERHTVPFVLLLVLSLAGVIYGWRARLTTLGWVCALVIVFVGATLLLSSLLYGVPEDFADIEAQFKYGSIGSDHPMSRGIPYWIWRVLPEVLPASKVSPDGFKPRNGKSEYEAFGFLREDKTFSLKNGSWVEATTTEEISGGVKIDRPIGFSKRRVFGLDFIGANCAFCHVSKIRKTPQSEPELILGMPGNTEDPEKFFLYLFAAASDPSFTASNVMESILKRNAQMNLVERLVYRVAVIPRFRYEVLQLKKSFDFIDPKNPHGRLPAFGPGRVETWSAYKKTFVHPPQPADIPGISDFPSIWNQKARAGMKLHWDGNNEFLRERNIVASLGVVGSNIEFLDLPRLMRITDWITWLTPPRYEDRVNGYDKFAIKWKQVERGKGLYWNYCAACHAPEGERIGRVEPLEAYQHQTDANRLKSFTPELADALNRLGTDSWELRHFKPQKGYVNTLLDGIWLRAPYLHNGSVPTLRDLLNQPKDRPIKFCRGNDLYDWKNLGFVSAMVRENGADSCGEFFLYDTTVPGNRNAGHLYGTDLPNADKEALLQYLKTL